MRHSAAIQFKPITFTGGEYTLIQDDVNKTLVVDEVTDVIINTPNLTMEEGDFIGIKQANTGKFTLVEDGNTLVSIGSLISGGQGAYVSLVKTSTGYDVVGSTEVSGGGAYIPLAGTDVGSPVTGNIEILDGNELVSPLGLDLYKGIKFDGADILMYSQEPALSESIIIQLSKTNVGIVQSTPLEGSSVLIINTDSITSKGLSGANDYTANITDLDYVQKKYSDKQHSYSTTEQLTGGTWIDGKPIYRRVLTGSVDDSSPAHLLQDLNDWNVEHVSISSTLQLGDDTKFSGNFYNNGLSATSTRVHVEIDTGGSDNNLYIRQYTDSGTIYYFIGYEIILEYTKTTD